MIYGVHSLSCREIALVYTNKYNIGVHRHWRTLTLHLSLSDRAQCWIRPPHQVIENQQQEEDDLIKPQKLINPILASVQRRALHQELLFCHRRWGNGFLSDNNQVISALSQKHIQGSWKHGNRWYLDFQWLPGIFGFFLFLVLLNTGSMF